MLQQYADHVGRESCLIIDKEDSLFGDIYDAPTLEQYIYVNIQTKTNVFVDEIQHITDRDKAILSIYSRYKDTINIIIT